VTQRLDERIVGHWYRPHLTLLTAALTPFAWVFGGLARLRRAMYAARRSTASSLPVPVIVIGNITVGGAGKTPLVIALAQALAARGFHPGVVSRGYGRTSADVRIVEASSSAAQVGDEPLLMARRGLHVAVGSRRRDAGRALLHAFPECDVIVADDGLQHYALPRDMEIAVVDGVRGLGNRRLLPAGPLREPASRLHAVDAVVINEPQARVESDFGAPTFAMHLAPREFVNVAEPTKRLPTNAFAGQCVHAIAAIGHPARYFATLRTLGIEVVPHAFPDHHALDAQDLPREGSVILMTEKDAVKCSAFADARCWFLRVEAEVDSALFDAASARVQSKRRAS